MVTAMMSGSPQIGATLVVDLPQSGPWSSVASGYTCGMNETNESQYYVRATEPKSDEQVAFICSSLAAANAKAAELRMGGYKDVVISVAKSAENEPPRS